MRSQDYILAIAVRDYWHGIEQPNVKICPLLADLERLIVYLDEAGIAPGNVIDPCRECGQEHRWALLSKLVMYALEIYPPEESHLMTMVNKRVERVRAQYGGEEGYREMKEAAEQFFKKFHSGNKYTL